MSRFRPIVPWGRSPQEVPGDIIEDIAHQKQDAAMKVVVEDVREELRRAEQVRASLLARKLLAEKAREDRREREAQEAVDAFRSLLQQGPVDLRKVS